MMLLWLIQWIYYSPPSFPITIFLLVVLASFERTPEEEERETKHIEFLCLFHAFTLLLIKISEEIGNHSDLGALSIATNGINVLVGNLSFLEFQNSK